MLGAVAVQGVSFPRAGHHLLVRQLFNYFSSFSVAYRLPLGRAYRIFSVYSSWASQHPFVYCDYYAHCRTVGCSDKRTTLQKNHDFNLDLELVAEKSYLVQIRDPYSAIISWYELAVARGWEGVRDGVDSWEIFLEAKLDFFRRFSHKWLTSDLPCRRLVIDYESLLNLPYETLEQVLRFMRPNEEIRADLLRRAIELPRVPRKVRAFRYHSDETEQYIRTLLRNDIADFEFAPTHREELCLNVFP